MKCEICHGEKKPKEIIEVILDHEETHTICSTCFLLTSPPITYLKQINIKDCEETPTYNLNSYLYNTIMHNKGKSYKEVEEDINNDDDEDLPDKEKLLHDNYGDFIDAQNLSPIFGRENEIEDIINVLSKKDKNNVLLLGESGVGKTAIVKGLAYKIQQGTVPNHLKNKRILSVNLTSIVAGTKYRGEFEAKFEKFIKKIKKNKNIILFFDEIHQIIGAGNTEDTNITAANMLKPLMAEGSDFQVIGATTYDEYKKSIELDKAFDRRFQKISIKELSKENTVKLLELNKEKYEKFHNISITSNTIEQCVQLADKYIKYRNFPDKALDLLDTACAYKKNNFYKDAKCETISSIINECYKKYDITLNFTFSDLFFNNIPNFAEFSREIQERTSNLDMTISQNKLDYNSLVHIVEEWTHIPVNNLDSVKGNSLKNLHSTLTKKIIGQDEAAKTVSKAILRRRMAISSTTRPASFLFVGETGIGKTQLAKELAINLFGDEKRLIRFDMSEYMEAHSVSKLIGAPPGYVGYQESGILIEALKKTPFCILLFDEIEKAHKDVMNIFLQILDDGVVTDARGNKINCENCIVIMTSNAGCKDSKPIGISPTENLMNITISNNLKKTFAPEFLGRINSIVYFNELTSDDYKSIAELNLKELISNLKKMNIDAEYSDDVIEYIVKSSNCENAHAREIKRTITEKIEDPIADFLIDNIDSNIKSLNIEVENNTIIIRKLTNTSVCLEKANALLN